MGSGIAGLSYALKVAEFGTVAVVTKVEAEEGCTQYAQGGVCAVLDPLDSVESHIRDTFVAGCFLNNLGCALACTPHGHLFVGWQHETISGILRNGHEGAIWQTSTACLSFCCQNSRQS